MTSFAAILVLTVKPFRGKPTYMSPRVKGYTDVYVILTYTGTDTCRLGYLDQKSTFSGKG